MSVSLAARRLSLAPMGWWHPKARIAFDFARGRYMKGGIARTMSGLLTAQRAGALHALDGESLLVSAAGHQPLVLPGRGLLANGQFSTKCTNANANPTDLTGVALQGSTGGAPDPGVTLTLVDDVSALDAKGLSELCSSGKVYRLNNPPGGTAARAVFSGIPGNTNSHALSCFMRGSGDAQLRFQGGAGTGSVALSADYKRLLAVGTPNASSFPMYVLALPGADVYFILNQLVESTFDPSVVIPTSDGTAYASDIWLAQGVRPSNGQPEPFTGWEAAALDDGFLTSLTLPITRLNASTARVIAVIGTDAGNAVKLLFDTDNKFKLVIRKAGADVVSIASGALAAPGTVTVHAQAKRAAFSIAATGVADDGASDDVALPTLSTCRLGSNFGLANPFNGVISTFEVGNA